MAQKMHSSALLLLVVSVIALQQTQAFLIKEKFLPKFLNVEENEDEVAHHVIKIPKLNLWKPWEDLFEKIEKKKELKEAKFEKDLDLIEEKKLNFEEKMLDFFSDKDKTQNLFEKLIEKKEQKLEKLEEKKLPPYPEKSAEVVYEKKNYYRKPVYHEPPPAPPAPQYLPCYEDDEDYALS